MDFESVGWIVVWGAFLIGGLIGVYSWLFRYRFPEESGGGFDGLNTSDVVTSLAALIVAVTALVSAYWLTMEGRVWWAAALVIVGGAISVFASRVSRRRERTAVKERNAA